MFFGIFNIFPNLLTYVSASAQRFLQLPELRLQRRNPAQSS